MRPLARLGMAALMAAVALTAGCDPARIQELEFQNRQLNQQNSTLQGKLATTQKDLTLASREAAHYKQLSQTHSIGAAEARRLRDAELVAAQAQIANLKRQVADALKQPAGGIQLPPALDKKLQQFAARFPNIVTYEPRTGMVQYKDASLLFELGSDKVLAGAQASLQTLAGVLNSAEAADFDIVIVGHTDTTRVAVPTSVQRYGDNWGLSAFRARSVMKALKSAGVPETKMAIMGFSEFRPIAAEKAKNRRVEIFFERANRFSPGVIQAAAPAPGGVVVP